MLHWVPFPFRPRLSANNTYVIILTFHFQSIETTPMDLTSQSTPTPRSRAAQIIPPLLLLPLLILPVDVHTLMLWLIGGIAALISMVTLSLALISPTRRHNALRPFLTLLFFLLAVATAATVEALSERSSSRLIAELQETCNVNGRCPDTMAGWRNVSGTSSRRDFHWKYTYAPTDQYRGFALVIAMRYEAERCVSGGVGVPVQETTSVQCRRR